MQFKVNLDLSQNELQNARLHGLATAPASPKDGQFYWNTSDNEMFVYSESKHSWVSASGKYTLPVASQTVLGGVMIGTNVDVDASGKISIKDATNAQKGLIQIATDVDVSTGTSEILAVNPKQLHDASTTASASAVAAVVAMKGQNDGIAPLGSDGKVPVAHIPDAIMTGMYLGGSFDASGIATVTTQLQSRIKISDATIQLINSATDDTSQPIKEYGYKTLEGAYFLADATFEIGGVVFEVGDWLVGFGTKWAKIDNTDAVISVNGKIGVVTIDASDVGLGNVANTGDSATPVEGGTTKFTTGGAYTELAKKVDIQQTAANAGKILRVNADGSLALVTYKLSVANGAITPDASGVATWDITHNWGSKDVQVYVLDNVESTMVGMDIKIPDSNTVTIKWNASATVPADTYRAVITL